MLTIHGFLLSTFVYSMCSYCGLESILILILVSVIQGILTMAPFFNKISTEIRKIRRDKINSYIKSNISIDIIILSDIFYINLYNLIFLQLVYILIILYFVFLYINLNLYYFLEFLF